MVAVKPLDHNLRHKLPCAAVKARETGFNENGRLNRLEPLPLSAKPTSQAESGELRFDETVASLRCYLTSGTRQRSSSKKLSSRSHFFFSSAVQF